jgi:effector-binding domain-containing protein
MSPQVEIKTLQPQTTVAIRTITTPAEIGPTMGQLLPEIWAYLEQQGVPAAGPPFARYHDFNDDRADLEAGFPVAAPVAGDGRIVAGELPGGEVAVAWHVGPYDTLSQAHHAVEAWIAEQGRAMAGAPWEVYWTDPGENPDPATWRTEVVWPVG